jgi:ADP-ribosylglycohydrolase
MFGAICGDIIGSVFERDNIKTEDFPLFSPESTYTDDTVLTVAVADCIMSGRDYADVFKEYGRKYPYAGYGGMFFKWIFSETAEPYNSFGNGSAMRVSPVGFAFNDLDLVLEEAKRCAGVTHNHPEGIKGAQAVAAAVFLARQGESKETIKNYVSCKFGYNLDRTLAEIRPHYVFDVTCQGSVPEAIIVFLESAGYEEAVRKAVSIGGDSDTIACITEGSRRLIIKRYHTISLKGQEAYWTPTF